MWGCTGPGRNYGNRQDNSSGTILSSRESLPFEYPRSLGDG